MKSHKILTPNNNKSLARSSISACIAAALGLGGPSLAYSQTQEQAEEVVERISITGSRIPTDPNATSSVPLQGLNSDDIRNSGELNLADIVNDIPALVSSLTSENSTTGANSLNLRGLGGERTLTLVNGRRHGDHWWCVRNIWCRCRNRCC